MCCKNVLHRINKAGVGGKDGQNVKARDMNGWYLKIRNPGRTSSISISDEQFIGPRNTRIFRN